MEVKKVRPQNVSLTAVTTINQSSHQSDDTINLEMSRSATKKYVSRVRASVTRITIFCRLGCEIPSQISFCLTVLAAVDFRKTLGIH